MQKNTISIYASDGRVFLSWPLHTSGKNWLRKQWASPALFQIFFIRLSPHLLVASSVGAVTDESNRVQDRASRSMPPSLGIGAS